QERDVLIDMLVAGGLEGDGLGDDVGAFGEVFAGVAGVFVIGIAEVDDGQIAGGEAGGVDVEDIAVVVSALLEAAVVGEDDGAAVVGESEEGDVVFGDTEAGGAGFGGGEEIDVGLDADDGGLGFGAGLGGGVGGLEGFEAEVGGVVAIEIAVDEEVVGEFGGIDGGDDGFGRAADVVLGEGGGAEEEGGCEGQEESVRGGRFQQ